MVRYVPIGGDSNLSDVQGGTIAFGESKDNVYPCLSHRIADSIHFGGMQGHRIRLVFLQDGLSVNKRVGPGRPGITCDIEGSVYRDWEGVMEQSLPGIKTSGKPIIFAPFCAASLMMPIVLLTLP